MNVTFWLNISMRHYLVADPILSGGTLKAPRAGQV